MNERQIETIVRGFYPDVQAIYLFGSFGTSDERPDSDVDIALLFPAGRAEERAVPAAGECRFELEKVSGRTVDLVSLREVSTVFQKEIVMTGRLVYCGDRYAVDEFEMLTMSYYQRLNEERREILESFYKTRRAYAV